MKRLFSVVVMLACMGAYAQEPRRTIDIADVFEQALTGDSDSEREFEGLQIQFTKLEDKSIYEYLVARHPDKVNKSGQVELVSHIIFTNCLFEKSLDFEKIVFKNLTLTGCSVGNQRFSNAQFQLLKLQDNKTDNSIELSGVKATSLEIKENSVGYEIYIEKDSIVGDTFIEGNKLDAGEIVVSSCYFNGSVTVGNNEVSGVLIENSDFKFPEYGEFNNYKLADNISSDLYLTSNHFSGDETSKVYFNKGNYLNLDIRKNEFAVNVYFIENKAEERFFLVDNKFDRHVSFEKFLFSETWNELYWKQLAGYKLRYADYGGETKEELDDEIKYSNLINIYKGLHTIFLSRGDIESANACYSEMKQLQGRRLKLVFQEKRSFSSFLRWQLNVLLKVYTNHGTDPALAVVMSFFVIMFFAMLYLFFPSEWDSDSVNRLLISYEQFLQRKKKASLAPILVVFGSVLLTLINSITLSINSFVTLGFGSIPTKGFARYLCIVEGFIGWFLLSIFTVALINQVLA